MLTNGYRKMQRRTCEKCLKVLADRNYEIAVEEFIRESCGSNSASCPYRTEDNMEYVHKYMLAYLRYLSLSNLDEEFEKIVSEYVAWEQANC